MIRLHPNFEKLVIPIKTPILDILDLSKGPQTIKHIVHCYPTKRFTHFRGSSKEQAIHLNWMVESPRNQKETSPLNPIKIT